MSQTGVESTNKILQLPLENTGQWTFANYQGFIINPKIMGEDMKTGPGFATDTGSHFVFEKSEILKLLQCNHRALGNEGKDRHYTPEVCSNREYDELIADPLNVMSIG